MTYSGSRSYREMITLVKRVHELIQRNEGDSAEADEVREAMDRHWDSLSEDEEALVNQLSADLYTLTDPPFSPVIMAAPDIEEALARAITDERWPEALNLLRRNRGLRDPAERARLRGQGWLHLGELEVAARFLQQASRLLNRAAFVTKPGAVAARRKELQSSGGGVSRRPVEPLLRDAA